MGLSTSTHCHLRQMIALSIIFFMLTNCYYTNEFVANCFNSLLTLKGRRRAVFWWHGHDGELAAVLAPDDLGFAGIKGFVGLVQATGGSAGNKSVDISDVDMLRKMKTEGFSIRKLYQILINQKKLKIIGA